MKTIGPIHRIRGYMTANIYLLEGEGGLVVIDPGVVRDVAQVARAAKNLGRNIHDISNIILTHFHVDHSAGAARLKKASGAKVLAHRDDATFLSGEAHMPSVFDNGVLGHFLCRDIMERPVEMFSEVPPVEVDVELKDGEIIPVLGGLEVMLGSGHTPGCIALFWEKEKAVFTGDIIVNSFHFPTLPTKGFSCDWDLTEDSARKVAMAALERGTRILCPGHGPMVYENIRPKLKRFIKRHGHSRWRP